MDSHNKRHIRFSFSIPLLVIFFLFLGTSTLAKMVTFEEEYTYQASELDSKVSCRTISIEQVKRLLLEELGTYLESYTEVKDFQLTKDKLTALTAGIVQIQILDEKWDGKNYWLKAKVSADPEDIAKSIDTLRRDQKKAEELEDIKRKSDDALREVERLRNELKELKSDIKAKEKYDKSVETLEHAPKGKQLAAAIAGVPQYKFVASKNSDKYHFPSCKWALRISPKNLVKFKSAKEALGAGYIPCKVCKPPTQD
jgi:hypothetical protein